MAETIVDKDGYAYASYNAAEIDSWSFADFASQVFLDNEAKGFHKADKTVTGDLMLMVTELVEAFEEHRDGHSPDEVYFVEDKYGVKKPEGIPIEIADAVIRILHFVSLHNIDLAAALATKLNYNRTRPYKHDKNF